MPTSISTQFLETIPLPLLAREYLSTLYATCTDDNELEIKTVINYLNELITEDELKNVVKGAD